MWQRGGNCFRSPDRETYHWGEKIGPVIKDLTSAVENNEKQAAMKIVSLPQRNVTDVGEKDETQKEEGWGWVCPLGREGQE